MEDLDSSEPRADRPPLLALTGSAQNTVRAESASRAARLRGPVVPVRMSPEFGSDGRQLATREERGAPSGVSAGPQGLVLTAEALPLNPWPASSTMPGSRATVPEFGFPGRQTGYGSQGGLQADPERRESQSGVRAEPQGSLLTADAPRPFSRLPMQTPMGARPASVRQTELEQQPVRRSLDGGRPAPSLSQRWDHRALEPRRGGGGQATGRQSRTVATRGGEERRRTRGGGGNHVGHHTPRRAHVVAHTPRRAPVVAHTPRRAPIVAHTPRDNSISQENRF